MKVHDFFSLRAPASAKIFTGSSQSRWLRLAGNPILWHIMRQYVMDFNKLSYAVGTKGIMIKEYFVNYYRNNSQLEIR